MILCSYPTVRFVAYESRYPGFIFVADPSQRGRYVMTDRSVALVACPYCKSIVCEPCQRKGRYHAGTHADRRNLARRKTGKATDVVKPHFKLKSTQELPGCVTETLENP